MDGTAVQTRLTEQLDRHPTLPPFPRGWFCVGFGHELGRGQVRSRRFAGEEIVLFRTASGRAVAMGAWCPHMGAHFGRTGALVEGESLRCAFHGFAFDGRGECVATGYGTKPPVKARARVWPLREVNGLLMAWFDPDSAAPAWDIPAVDWHDFTPLAWSARTFSLHSHPQTTSENSVDIGHLSWVHGYESVEVLEPLATDGPNLTASYAMSRPSGVIARLGRNLRAEFDVDAWGLGYSFVDVRVPAHNLHSRHFVLATPTDAGKIDLRLALAVERGGPTKRVPRFARGPIERVIAMAVFRGYVSDARADFPMWENTRHTHPPVLAAGDGPIIKFRRWASQFY
jgi:phenylpropionate dioxygenase-like ring-hydroxylating dioxygenase large terminal subunit